MCPASFRAFQWQLSRVSVNHRLQFGSVNAPSLRRIVCGARHRLRALLERESDMMVVGEAADGRESIQIAEEQTPDVVVMDLAMPNMNGMEATRRILAANSRVGVVILSMHQDESYVLGALRAGAKGYLLKDSIRTELVQAIRTVAEGRSFLTRKVSRMLQEDYIIRLQQRGLEDRYGLLSDREREILQYIAEGRANKEVANILNISVTVETIGLIYCKSSICTGFRS
jgi:two-component system response regulator NreC